MDIFVLLLDITKAFDFAGHAHIKEALQSQPIPSRIRNIVIKLQENNKTQIMTKQGKTKKYISNDGFFKVLRCLLYCLT